MRRHDAFDHLLKKYVVTTFKNGLNNPDWKIAKDRPSFEVRDVQLTM
jgi:hypothetical protein